MEGNPLTRDNSPSYQQGLSCTKDSLDGEASDNLWDLFTAGRRVCVCVCARVCVGRGRGERKQNCVWQAESRGFAFGRL